MSWRVSTFVKVGPRKLTLKFGQNHVVAQAEIEVNLELQVRARLTEKDISMSPTQQVNKDFSLTITPLPPKMLSQ